MIRKGCDEWSERDCVIVLITTTTDLLEPFEGQVLVLGRHGAPLLVRAFPVAPLTRLAAVVHRAVGSGEIVRGRGIFVSRGDVSQEQGK